jgi:hypothetical protein
VIALLGAVVNQPRGMAYATCGTVFVIPNFAVSCSSLRSH